MLSQKDLSGTRKYSIPDAPGTPRWTPRVSGSFRIRNELRNSGAFAEARSV